MDERVCLQSEVWDVYKWFLDQATVYDVIRLAKSSDVVGSKRCLEKDEEQEEVINEFSHQLLNFLLYFNEWIKNWKLFKIKFKFKSTCILRT